MKSEKITIGLVLALLAVIGLIGYTQFAIEAANKNLELAATAKLSTGGTNGAQMQQAQGAGVLPYNQAGYEQMLQHYKAIKLDNAQSKTVAGLDVELPCCGFKDILTNSDGTANFAGSCHCGHHDAMYGLAKYMVSNGYGRNEIQKELNAWKGVFFPSQGSGNLGGCA